MAFVSLYVSSISHSQLCHIANSQQSVELHLNQEPAVSGEGELVSNLSPQ